MKNLPPVKVRIVIRSANEVRPGFHTFTAWHAKTNLGCVFDDNERVGIGRVMTMAKLSLSKFGLVPSKEPTIEKTN